MKAGKILVLIVLVLGCSLLIAQKAAETLDPPQPLDSSQYVLGPDDQLKIWVLGVEEITDKPVHIDPSGNLDLPLIGKIHAAGLTAEQFKASLVEAFSKDLLRPQVSVEVVDFGSQPVSISGAINHPGVHQLRGRKTLGEVLSLVDGLRQDAGPRIIITRQIQYGPIPLSTAKTDPSGKFSVAEVRVKEFMAGANPTENILICPHDMITIPTAEAVFVVGEVRKPGEIALKDRETILVSQALASAEGYGPTPAPQNAKIVRIVPDTKERKEIPVDLRKVLEGKAEDIAMRPNDILLVPISAPKKVAVRAAEAAIQTATGVIIWRHP